MPANTPNVIRHFIGSDFLTSQSKETFINLNPATETQLRDVALGSEYEIDLAVQSAQTALQNPAWAALKSKDRANFLLRIADGILKKQKMLAELETIDTGKPLGETLNGDIPRAAYNFQFFANLLLDQSFLTYISDDGSHHTSIRQPLGVCGLITPWNLPLYLETWKIAPALAMGNTVILKPAELTPLTANALAEITSECGLPPGVFNVVHGFGSGSTGEALVKHPDVKAISFTGETTTGKTIMQNAAPSLKKLSFELGGKGASVIFADADLTEAATTSVKAAFRNQGQICLAGSRLLVQEQVYDQVLELVLTATKQIKIGDPLDMQTTMGALISKEHLARVHKFVIDAKQQSHLEICCGGKQPGHLNNGYFYQPTVITNVAQESALIQEEIFGPVLTVQKFRDDEEALALLNGTKYGLSCSIWSNHVHRLQYMAQNVQTGLVWLNCWFLRNLHTAFGGMKQSGIGREGGYYSFDFFSEQKTITSKYKPSS